MKSIKYLIFFAIVIFAYGCNETIPEKIKTDIFMYKVTYAQYYISNDSLGCVQYPLDSVELQIEHGLPFTEVFNLHVKKECPDNIKNWINDSIQKINVSTSYIVVQDSMILEAPYFKQDTVVFLDTIEYVNRGGINMVYVSLMNHLNFLKTTKLQ